MKSFRKINLALSAPVISAIIILAVFASQGLYPFGTGSVTWCDMSQQTLPLLLDFKDILSGKESLFLNMANAGGMNFYGVFFFFLSSPFTFLTAFIPKGDMVTFVNILVILKLSLCAFTAYMFFKKSYPLLKDGIPIILSVMYALSGYGMLFYQNLMWLDIMYLFPLLMLALNSLVKKGSILPFMLCLSAIITVNYYISFMVAVFILLFAGSYIFSHNDKKGEISLNFIIGTVISLLLTAVVWLPSYLEVEASARSGEKLKQTLTDASFLTSYKTVLPLILCSAFLIAVVIIGLLSSRKKSAELKQYLSLFFLTFIPIIIEPVNLMWHTGSYMSFPARYGFITVFIGLICSAELLKEDQEEIKPLPYNIPITVLGFGLIIAVGMFAKIFVDRNIYILSAYTDTLWGDNFSFDYILQLFFVIFICYTAVYLLYRHKKIAKASFLILISLIMVIEGMTNTRIYMTSYYERDNSKTDSFKAITDLSDEISDDGFYRVITDEKITDYNMLGALGYNTLSHYTSLTDKNYMYTQKRLGYTSVWMEVSSHGGTELTNALYSAKYKIIKDYNNYSVEEQSHYLGLGIVTDRDTSKFEEIPSSLTRAEIQEYVFSSLWDGSLITEYDYSNLSKGINKTSTDYSISAGAEINYNTTIEGRQSLYFDCFDRLSNDLTEEYYNSLKITVNGELIEKDFPTTSKNGLLYLGEFENEEVQIQITAHKNIYCYSFGVFGLDLDTLEDAINTTKTASLSYNGGKISGNYISDGDESIILAIPYNKGLNVNINGEKAEFSKTLSNFVAFNLEKGNNRIEITLTPNGFILGLALSGVGLALLITYIIFKKKFKSNELLSFFATVLASLAVIIGITVIYIYPVIAFLGLKSGIIS